MPRRLKRYCPSELHPAPYSQPTSGQGGVLSAQFAMARPQNQIPNPAGRRTQATVWLLLMKHYASFSSHEGAAGSIPDQYNDVIAGVRTHRHSVPSRADPIGSRRLRYTPPVDAERNRSRATIGASQM